MQRHCINMLNNFIEFIIIINNLILFYYVIQVLLILRLDSKKLDQNSDLALVYWYCERAIFKYAARDVSNKYI